MNFITRAIANRKFEKQQSEQNRVYDIQRDQRFRDLIEDVRKLVNDARRRGLNPKILVIGVNERLTIDEMPQRRYTVHKPKKVSLCGRKFRIVEVKESSHLAIYEERPYAWVS